MHVLLSCNKFWLWDNNNKQIVYTQIGSFLLLLVCLELKALKPYKLNKKFVTNLFKFECILMKN